MRLYPGAIAVLTTTATVNGVTTDPSALSLIVTTPSGVTTAYVYGVSPLVTRTGVGVYAGSIACTEAGTWLWRWDSGGPTAQGADQGSFVVLPRNVGIVAP